MRTDPTSLKSLILYFLYGMLLLFCAWLGMFISAKTFDPNHLVLPGDWFQSSIEMSNLNPVSEYRQSYSVGIQSRVEVLDAIKKKHHAYINKSK